MILAVTANGSCGDTYRELSRTVLCSSDIQYSIIMVTNVIKKDDALEHDKRRHAALGPTWPSAGRATAIYSTCNRASIP